MVSGLFKNFLIDTVNKNKRIMAQYSCEVFSLLMFHTNMSCFSSLPSGMSVLRSTTSSEELEVLPGSSTSSEGVICENRVFKRDRHKWLRRSVGDIEYDRCRHTLRFNFYKNYVLVSFFSYFFRKGGEQEEGRGKEQKKSLYAYHINVSGLKP